MKLMIVRAEDFFNHLQRIANVDFMPTDEDILRVRYRTTGSVERTFRIADVNMKVVDNGGECSERRKWAHFFDSVCTYITYPIRVTDYMHGVGMKVCY